MNSERGMMNDSPVSNTMMQRFRIGSTMFCGLFLLLAATVHGQEAAPPPAPTDPTVRDLLESNPKTPSAITRTIKILLDLNQPIYVKPLLTKLIEAELSDEQLLALHEEFGSGLFLRMVPIKELEPAGGEFAGKVLAAVDKNLRDPERIATYIQQLSSAKPSERGQAITRLQQGHDAAAAALVGVLANSSRENEHRAVQEALLSLQGDSLGPLMVALDSGDPALAVRAIEVLGQLEHPDAELILYGPTFSVGQPAEVRAAADKALRRKTDGEIDRTTAAAKLYMLARSYYQQQHPQDLDSQNRAPAWRWDAEQKQPALGPLPAEVSSMRWASYWAGKARSISPDRAEIRRLYLGAVLEELSFRLAHKLATPDDAQKVLAIVGQEGTDVAEDLLVDAMSHGHPAVAARAAQILGTTADPRLLQPRGGRPSPLVEATRNADRRVRFAAVGAIMQLNPTASFPGSSYVTEALGFFVASSGAPQALVGAPQADTAQQLAALLGEVGYEAQIATSSQGLMEQAIASADYEFVLADMLLAAPTSGELLTRLARDSRTAKLPVGVIADAASFDAAQTLMLSHPNAQAFIRPMNGDGMKYIVVQLVERAGRSYMAPAERVAEAKQALAWIAALSAEKNQPYNLHRLGQVVEQALFVPDLTAAAADVLATLGTASAQRTLVQMADRPTQPLAQRQAAAAAFARSVERFGTLLTSGEVLQQYNLYNASEQEPRETQMLLASILDSIEARAAAAKASPVTTPR